MKKLITIMSLAIVGSSFAQEEPTFTVTGSVDAYWRANLSSVNDAAEVYNEEDDSFSMVQANSLFGAGDYSAFGNDSGFSLGMANVKFSYEGEKVGFVADMAYGPRATAGVNLNSNGSNNGVINEMYMYWRPSESTTFYMGRFNTWMGIEKFSPVDNFNYSMSHTFSFMPRNFNGLAANFDLGNDFSLGAGIMNPVDITQGNTSGDYSVGAGLTKGDTTLSFVSSQDATNIDFVTSFDITDTFDMAVNIHKADYEDTDFPGPGNGFTSVSLYPQFESSEDWTWGMRLEYIAFDDFVTDNVITPTLTANYSVGNLTIKPELRLDVSEEDIFYDNDGDLSSNLSSFMLGAVYSF